jgi:hypothetical protein
VITITIIIVLREIAGAYFFLNIFSYRTFCEFVEFGKDSE